MIRKRTWHQRLAPFVYHRSSKPRRDLRPSRRSPSRSRQERLKEKKLAFLFPCSWKTEKNSRRARVSISVTSNGRRTDLTHNIRSRLNESESDPRLYICIAWKERTHRYTSRSFRTIHSSADCVRMFFVSAESPKIGACPPSSA